MAIDEAILGEVGRGNSLPTLRLYTWDPPCLSLGYAQSVLDVDMDALRKKGWDLVRRPTGGRAILHTDELTYAVITLPDDPVMHGSVLESYRRVAAALLNAMQHLDLEAGSVELLRSKTDGDPGGVCFEVPSNYEITVGGKKLVGSAQARRREGVLQHGSFPLTGDLTRIVNVLRFPTLDAREQAASRLLEHASTAEMADGRIRSFNEAAQAFHEAFAQVLEIDLIDGNLSPAEELLSEKLEAEKYSHPAWTERL